MAAQQQQGDIDFNDPNQRFLITAELANTLQGRIYASTDKLTGQFTVIKETWKQLVKTGMSRDNCPVPEDFFEEKRLLNILSRDPNPHPNFVRIITEWEEPLTYNYAMEGCKDGDLFDFVKNKHLSSLKAERAKLFQSNMKHYSKHCQPNNTKDEWILSVQHMFRQLVDCTSWMHDRRICHLDMSLENTMVYDASKCFIKIIDFGLAKECPINKNKKFENNRRVGKRGYMAPEVYAKKKYDCRAADIWSLGVMLYMMLIGAPPYELPVLTCVPFKYLVNQRLREMLTHWKRLHYVTDDIIDLLRRIFRSEHKRITMDKIKKHPFVGLNVPLYPPMSNNKVEMKENSNNRQTRGQSGSQAGGQTPTLTHLSPTGGNSNKQQQSIPTVSDLSGNDSSQLPPESATSQSLTQQSATSQTETPKQSPVIPENRTQEAQASNILDDNDNDSSNAGGRTTGTQRTKITIKASTTTTSKDMKADMAEPSADPPGTVVYDNARSDAAGTVARSSTDVDVENDPDPPTRDHNGCIHCMIM